MENAIERQIQKEKHARIKKMSKYDKAWIQEYQKIEAMVYGSLENGFKTFHDSQYEKVDNSSFTFTSLEKYSRVFNWDFSPIIEQNKIQHILLTDIAQLLNIPDFEKERKAYIEKGLIFLKKALDNEMFYEDAKRFFDKALEQEDIDYYVLYNLGLIHLFSSTFISNKNANSYFTKAAKYAFVDIDFTAPKYSEHSSTFTSLINPKMIAGNSYQYAARTAYAASDLHKALLLINQAIEIQPKNSDFLFDKAIYLTELEKNEEALKTIEYLLKTDHFIALKILANMPMMQLDSVRDLLITFTNDTINEAKKEANRCSEIISNNSEYKNTLNSVRSLIVQGTLFSAKTALFSLT